MNSHPVNLPLQSVEPTCIDKPPMNTNSGLQAIVDNPEGMTKEEIESAEDLLLAIRNEAF